MKGVGVARPISADERPDAVDDVTRLYDLHYAAMLRLARLIMTSTAVAEEVVQDAFVTVYQRRRSIDQPGAYLRRVVVNNCSTTLRREKVERRKIEQIGRREGDCPILPAELDETWQSLERLSTKQRTALVLRYYEDLTLQGVAEAMDEQVGTVKSLIHRGLKRLRDEATP